MESKQEADQMEVKAVKRKRVKAPRVRKDTLSTVSRSLVVAKFQKILDEEDDTHYLIEDEAKIDVRGKTRNCLRLYSHKQEDQTTSIGLFSNDAYRTAAIWAMEARSTRYAQDLALKEHLAKGNDSSHHITHLCGNDWCCQPHHLKIKTRAANEEDKHFHHFLNHMGLAVRDAFQKEPVIAALLRENELF
jgi:hypothetical protein